MNDPGTWGKYLASSSPVSVFSLFKNPKIQSVKDIDFLFGDLQSPFIYVTHSQLVFWYLFDSISEVQLFRSSDRPKIQRKKDSVYIKE